MTHLAIDFEWSRDPKGNGYALREDPPPGFIGVTPSSGLSTFTPGASGIVLPPSLKPRVASSDHQRVIPSGARLEKYRPLAEYPALFQVFVKDAVDAGGVLKFINKFGPLTQDGTDKNVGEKVSFAVSQAHAMHRLLEAYISDDESRLPRTLSTGINIGKTEMARIEMKLVVDRVTQSPKLQFTVQDLLTALWLQLSQTIAGGHQFRSCLECTEFFEVGVGTGRRLDAKYCSDEHRVSFHSRRRTGEN